MRTSGEVRGEADNLGARELGYPLRISSAARVDIYAHLLSSPYYIYMATLVLGAQI